MPDTMIGPTLALRIYGRGALQGAREFEGAAQLIRSGGQRIDSSLRGVEGSFERLKASSRGMWAALAAGIGGFAGGILSQFGAQAMARLAAAPGRLLAARHRRRRERQADRSRPRRGRRAQWRPWGSRRRRDDRGGDSPGSHRERHRPAARAGPGGCGARRRGDQQRGGAVGNPRRARPRPAEGECSAWR